MKSQVLKMLSDPWCVAITFTVLACLSMFLWMNREGSSKEEGAWVSPGFAGRILVVKVVPGAAQIGEKLYPLDLVKDVVRARIKDEGIENFCVFAVDGAKFGDAVAVYECVPPTIVRRKQLSYASLGKDPQFPAIVEIKGNGGTLCGTSLGLDTFVFSQMQ